MNNMDCLRLQVEWGADEFLLDAPQDRRLRAAPRAAPPPAALPRLAPTLPAGPAAVEKIAGACTTLEELEQAVKNFNGCALRGTATHTIFGDGPADARLMLIGDAPAADEDRAGTAFAGPHGQLLDKMVASIGLSRADLRLTNILPWRPPGDRKPADSEIALCLPFVQRHIALVQPELVILLGAIAAKALLPEALGAQGIRRLRGTWRSLAVPGLATPVSCLPLYHPTYLLHLPSAKREAWHDLLALKAHLAAPPRP